MKDLVMMRDKKVVTTSLKVAESFQKAHRDVMRAIRNLTAQNCAVKNMFVESTYINQRRQQGLPQTLKEKLSLTMEVTSNLCHRVDNIEDDIIEVKDNSEINSLERYQLLQGLVFDKLEVVGGKESNYYQQHKANKVFSGLGWNFRKVFEVPRYEALSKKKFEKALEWTKTWYPDVILKSKITSVNKQLELLL